MLRDEYFAREEAARREEKKSRILLGLKESMREVYQGKPDAEELVQIAEGLITDELVQGLMDSGFSQVQEAGYRLAEQAIVERAKPKESKEVLVQKELLASIDAELRGEEGGDVIAERAKAMITEELFADLLNKEVWMRQEAMHTLVARARRE